jgi:circadian clock protein KaiB
MDAYNNLKRLCEAHLTNRYEIEIIDLLKDPQRARGDEIIAVPTVVRQLPAPMRKIIGDLSDTERVLLGLEMETEGTG